ncbi:MAG: phospholipid carrier-dependent glycosyltransferase [Novosphingobium sp.]|uniref:phospholipid carrier-dependent glycosyltransferase n=1 Tax=Novosphingobium sp. TaxID=1874826 RepID=UPI0032BC30BF
MTPPFTTERDPFDWSVVITLLFLSLCWWRMGVPSEVYFDEVHYVKAARNLIEGQRINPEHPMFGKILLAAAIRWLGDSPLYWRVPSALAGALGLFAIGRMVWFASGRRLAALGAMVLVATNFFWFIQSRIAMLDMMMAGLAMLALWQIAAAIRVPHQGRWRLALAGVLLGLALGTKWSVAPLLAVPGLVFAGMKLKQHRARFLLARGGGPVPGISLAEAALWLGLVPLAIYWLSFWPAFHWATNPASPWHPIDWHRFMIQLQDSVTKPHPYRSTWQDWIIDRRAIWYLYREIDGVQRGIVLIGNPVSMFAGLAALLWAAWAGLRHRRWDAVAFAALYLLTLAFWPLSGKPIQFFYHYLLPSTFLMATLALALEAIWRSEDDLRWLAPIMLGSCAAMFAWFYPIISGAPLSEGRGSYEFWMWFDSWR